MSNRMLLQLLAAGSAMASTIACPASAAAQAADTVQSVRIAPDPTGRGPYRTVSAEYHLPARRDTLVAPFTPTELWARVYMPADVKTARPVILMLHGNHATCGRFDPSTPGRIDDDVTYTDTGKCPDGYVVTPNHEGYAYLAERLATWGYVVVSINANRGINGAWGDDGDFGLNLRRGRLVLRHLLQLERWNSSNASTKPLGINLRGKLDLTQVGLLGHSRGGEGMRAALAQYRDVGSIWPMQFRTKPNFRAIFEIGPVDGQSDRVLDANDVAWNVLLPTCDGDVSTLEGQRAYDRMVTARAEQSGAPKSIYAVAGANHNFYNTEWQQSDSNSCYSLDNSSPPLFDTATTGSEKQRATALYAVTAFFRANLGSDPVKVFGTLLDPAYRLPKRLDDITLIKRTYTDNALRRGSAVFDDFTRPADAGAGGIGNVSSGLTYFVQNTLLEHDPVARFGILGWDAQKTPRAWYQANLAVPGRGVSPGAWDTLEFRAGLVCDGFDPGQFGQCAIDRTINPSGTTNFSIALVTTDGTFSRTVTLSRYAKLLPPTGVSYQFFPVDRILPGDNPGDQPSGNAHPVLQSVRIPLADFELPRDAKIRGVRLTFDRVSQGGVYLGNVRLSRVIEGGDKIPDPVPGPFLTQDAAPVTDAQPTTSAASAIARRAPITGGYVSRIYREKRAIGTAQAAMAPDPRRRAAYPTQRDVVTIAIVVPQPITIGDALMTLRVGGQLLRLGEVRRYGSDGLRLARFVVTPEQFATLEDGAALSLENGGQAFDLGKLDKAMLR